MLRQITASTASSVTGSRSAERTESRPSARSIRQAERPETALEELLERWIAAGLPRGVGMLGLWLRRLRHRHELAKLTQAQLRDVGLDAGCVRRESEKPFWQV
jgi:uncharacterized protein YjiS (DUF1127 family)